MKRYIKSSIDISQGSYLLDRSGQLIPTALHVPSTTFVGRGILQLCPTDAEFLWNQKKISKDDAILITQKCFHDFLKGKPDSIVDRIQFNDYAELRYAPKLRSEFMAERISGSLSEEESAKFNELNGLWYSYLQNNYVKVSVFKNNLHAIADFRISSTDGFNWNAVIIDKVILKLSEPRSYRYSIVKEVGGEYRAYFINATLNDILENDKIVLSSTKLSRSIVDGEIIYRKS